MTGARAPLRSVGVVGGGPVALLAAALVARALPRAEVVLVETAVGRGDFADRLPLLPPILASLHDAIGLDEAWLVDRCRATPWLATRALGWPGGGAETWVVHGAPPPPGTGAPGVAQALAVAGRFAVPDGRPGDPLADLDHGWCVEPGCYAALLAEAVRAAGVRRTGPTCGVRHGAEGTVEVHLADGSMPIAADLWIDASGTAAWLAFPDAVRVSWRAELPLDTVAGRPSARSGVALADEVMAARGGYRWSCPRKGVPGFAVSRSGSGAVGEAVTLVVGRLGDAWRGRVVTIGDAFASFAPFAGLNLLLAARQLQVLLALLPGRDVVASERAEANARMAALADEVRRPASSRTER